MKILVTGANGYLGKGIVKALLDHGFEVIGVGHSNTEVIDERAHTIICDIFSVCKPYEFFGKPDVLLHLAWRDGFMHYSSAHIDDLPKHYKFIREFTESGCKQIVIMGSMHEVGFFEGSINELTVCKPTTPYGIGKNALRELTAMLCEQNDCIFQWLRGFYIVGNANCGSSIFSKIIKASEEGKKTFPFTMGLNQYDFIDYDVFCNYVVAAVSQIYIQGIINICSGRPEKLCDRVERFIKENKLDICLQYGLFQDRPYDSKAIWGDSSKIEAILERN